jgi:hypothetical protein
MQRHHRVACGVCFEDEAYQAWETVDSSGRHMLLVIAGAMSSTDSLMVTSHEAFDCVARGPRGDRREYTVSAFNFPNFAIHRICREPIFASLNRQFLLGTSRGVLKVSPLCPGRT